MNGYGLAVMAMWPLSVIAMLTQGRIGDAALDAFAPMIGIVHGLVIVLGWIESIVRWGFG